MVRPFFSALIVCSLLSWGVLQANELSERAIRTFLIKHQKWTMFWEITDAQLPGERAHRLNYEFFEQDQKLMARLIFEYGGCSFPVGLQSDSISLRYCILEGEPSLTFDPADAKYPFKQRNNPRKLWLTPTP